jgi:signal transduction histidine kinase
MQADGTTRSLDGWERWTQQMLAYSPFGLLLLSFGLTVAINRPPASLLITLGTLSVATAGWIVLERVVPRWSRTPVGRVVFFAGLIAFSASMIWRSGWYAIFIIIVYGFAFEVFPVRWAVFASCVVAVVHTRGFFGEWPTTTAGVIQFVLLAAAIAVLASAFTLLGAVSSRQATQRKVIIGELLEANRKLAASMAENAKLHAQLVDQAEKAAVVAERQRMAREIHDTLAQGLTGIITQLEAAEQADNPAVSRHLGTATWLARQSLAEARRSVHAIRPEALELARLPEAIENTARQWSDVNEVATEVHITGNATKLPADVEVALLRAAQEALANIAKHAGASRVGLTLSYMPDLVTLDVRDDGAGFDPTSPAPDPGQGGYGLTGMRQRLDSVGGSLVIETEPGAGTALSASVPLATVKGENVSD